MEALIIGAAGMLGSQLAGRLLGDGQLAGEPLDTLVLADWIEPAVPAVRNDQVAVQTLTLDLANATSASHVLARRPQVIFHLAAIVSGEAEADFDKGYRINLDGTRQLFDAIAALHAAEGYRPRLVFTSSIAVFGAPFPECIDDEFLRSPLTSYGTQKAIGELLLADYTRRGLMDGIGLRLPTLCIRPGQANLAASSFFSNILREPIHGRPAVLPVDDTVRHWFASPHTAVQFLVHAAGLAGEAVGPRRNLNLPGLSATVGEQIEALERMVGSAAVRLIERQPDPVIAGIVAGWPQRFDAQRALALGFVADRSFDDIIQVYLDDAMTTA